MSERIQIEPVIGWPAYCDEIMSRLSLTQLEVSNLKVEVVDLTDAIDALEAENERLRKALEPFVKMAGMMPLTHGPNNEPVSNDEPVSVSCCGFYLGDLTAADLNAVFNLEAKP